MNNKMENNRELEKRRALKDWDAIRLQAKAVLLARGKDILLVPEKPKNPKRR